MFGAIEVKLKFCKTNVGAKTYKSSSRRNVGHCPSSIICCFVSAKIDSGNSGGNVIGKYEAMDKRWHIYVNSSGDGLIYWNIGGTNFGTSLASVIGTDWHHLAMVYDGTQSGNENRLKAYIDGEEIILTFTGTIPSSMTNISANVNIGRHSISNFFQGIIDEVKIYSCVLMKEEIQDEAGLS